MRWFKHLSNAAEDESMALLIDRFGLEGYGLWWRILEVIAAGMNKGSGRHEATYTWRKWRSLCGMYHQSRFKSILLFLASQGKFTLISAPSPEHLRTISAPSPEHLRTISAPSPEHLDVISKASQQDLLTISCPNLLKFRDEYHKKSGQTPDNVQKKSVACQEQETETETETETEVEVDKKPLCTEPAMPDSEPAINEPSPNKRIRMDYESREWTGITETEMEEWRKAYPACDIEREIDRAGLWLLANPTKRKKDCYRFLTNWIGRTQERGGTERGKKGTFSTPDGRVSEITARNIEIGNRWLEKRMGKNDGK